VKFYIADFLMTYIETFQFWLNKTNTEWRTKNRPAVS